MIQIKKCRECGDDFVDASMFGQESRCDSCQMKDAKMWSQKPALSAAAKGERWTA